MTPADFQTATKDCESKGGKLATPSSAAAEKEILQVMTQQLSELEQAWDEDPKNKKQQMIWTSLTEDGDDQAALHWVGG